MALTVDQINAVGTKYIVPKMVDNIFKNVLLLNWMKKNGGYESASGGVQIQETLNYAKLTAAGSFSGAQTLDTVDNDTFTGALYDWKEYYANVTITGLDKIKNSGDSAKLNFVKDKMKLAEKTLADVIGADMYSTGTGTKISGLRNACSASNTVGGISQSSYSWWQAQVDSSTTIVTLNALQTMWGNCSYGENDKPDIITTTQSIFNYYYNVLTPQQRFADSDTAKGGFTNLLFNAAPVVVDHQCPASYAFFLNKNYIKLRYASQDDFRFTGFKEPINQKVESAKIFWTGNMTYSKCVALGVFSALAG